MNERAEIETVMELLDWYRDTYVSTKLAESTNDTIGTVFKSLKLFFGEMHPGAIEDEHIDAYIKARGNGEIGRGATEGTVHKEIAWLTLAITRAIKKKLLGRECTPMYDMPEKAKRRETVLTRDEVAHLLWMARAYRRRKASKDKVRLSRLERFFWIAVNTGHRGEAIVTRKWSRVDFANQTIEFNDPGQRPSTKRRKCVPLRPVLFRVLRRAYRERVSEYVFDRPTSVAQQIERLLDWMGAKKNITPHVFRHTLGTWLKAADQDSHAVGNIIGASAATVEKIYAKPVDAHLRDVLNAVRLAKT